MSWPKPLTSLRSILQELFSLPESARMIVDEAELPSGNIAFSSSALENWYAILREAHIRQKVPALVAVASQHYPEQNDRLSRALEEYQAAIALPPSVSSPSASAHPPAAPVPDNLNGTSNPSQFHSPIPGSAPFCDLAIVTALQEELEPVLALIGGRERWTTFEIDRFSYYQGQFSCGSQTLNVVAYAADRMGGASAVSAVHRLAQRRPRLLVMTGICAGRQEKGIALGDVIVADRAYQVGEGKQRGGTFQRDILTYQVKPWLLTQVKGFGHDEQWRETITTPRPRSLRYQGEWLLCQLAAHEPGYPATEADWTAIKANCPSYPSVKARLQQQNRLSSTGKLTAAGKKLIGELRDRNFGQFEPTPDPAAPAVHYMAFATSQAVIAVDKPFDAVADVVRNTGAIDMEVAAFYAAAEAIDVPALAVKGVCDFATEEKDDLFHAYAAEASARWMYGFVCAYAPILFDASGVAEAGTAVRAQRMSDPVVATVLASGPSVPPAAPPARTSTPVADTGIVAPPSPALPQRGSTVTTIRRLSLEQRFQALSEEYAAVNGQINSTLDAGQLVVLKRRAADLERELAQVEDELRQRS